MKNFTSIICHRQVKSIAIVATLLAIFNFSSTAQNRSFGIVYSDNIKGEVRLIGNTLMAASTVSRMNNNSVNGDAPSSASSNGNDGNNMQYVDIDGLAETRNSSSADLSLPAGLNTIKLARLYWGGRVKNSDFNMTQSANKQIKIKWNNDAYANYSATFIDQNNLGTNNNPVYQYQAYTDITSYIQLRGSGTYTIGNAPLSTGSIGSGDPSGGYYGGWTIVVVYQNLTLPGYNSIRIYDGFQKVDGNALNNKVNVTLTGLNVPSGVLDSADAKMGVMAWEGDANIWGDSLKINNIAFSNGLNQSNNPWNGTITDNGVHVTAKNPNYTNQMGIDIDQFNVGAGYGITPGATTVNLRFASEQDQYFPGLFTFQIKTGEPSVALDKLVTDANNNYVAEVNEALTYTLLAKNKGIGNANYTVIKDTLPNNVTFVPGSIKYIYGPGNYLPGNVVQSMSDNTDADSAEYIVNGSIKTLVFRVGKTAFSKTGVLEKNDSIKIQFKVTVNDPGQGSTVPVIINTARITSRSDADILSFDDGTAMLLGVQGGALPITLKSFTASLTGTHQVRVNWATALEINCSRYDIERSMDGHLFNTVATVAGSGNTSVDHAYFINDDITAVTSAVVYYRLKQVDADGKNNYSKIVSIRLKKSTNNFVVSPNPFNSYININVDWGKDEATAVKVFNMDGKQVAAKNIQMSKGTNYVVIDELSSLPAGNYILRFTTADGSIIKQITKQ